MNGLFKVFDLSLDLSAEETEQILNALCSEDRYLNGLVQMPGAVRVITRAKAAALTPPDESEALALLRAHPRLSLPNTVALLSQHGIRRTKDWVSQQRYLAEHPSPQSR